MKNTFISLGPSCIGAEILKAAGLRRHTYIFDWCRSGLIHYEEFLRYSPGEFVTRFVANPHISLEQAEEPSEMNKNTGHLKRKSNICGYDYIYSPHRDLNKDETIHYFIRAAKRTKQALRNNAIAKILLVCDYTNKRDYSYLGRTEEILREIANITDREGIRNYRIVAIRITLTEHQQRIKVSKVAYESLSDVKMEVFGIEVPIEMDTIDKRQETYRIIAGLVFGDIQCIASTAEIDLNRMPADSRVNKIFLNSRQETNQVLVRLCRHVDEIDPPKKNVYGKLTIRCPSKEIRKLIQQEQIKLAINWKTSTTSLPMGSRLLEYVLRSEWANEAIQVASTHAELTQPVITDIAISSSTQFKYAADNWHRDGLIGKRIKIFAILYASDECCQLQFIPESGILSTCPKIFESYERSKETDEMIEKETKAKYGMNCIHETEYHEGDIFYFDTNMLHRRKAPGKGYGLINRLAIVIEVMSYSRAEIMSGRGPIGRLREPPIGTKITNE